MSKLQVENNKAKLMMMNSFSGNKVQMYNK